VFVSHTRVQGLSSTELALVRSYIVAKHEKILKRPGVVRREHDGIWVGAQPSVDDLTRLAAAGCRSVLNLRHLSEAGSIGLGVLAREEELVRELSMTYANVPCTMKDPLPKEALRAALAAPKPLLVHCAFGVRAQRVVDELCEPPPPPSTTTTTTTTTTPSPSGCLVPSCAFTA